MSFLAIKAPPIVHNFRKIRKKLAKKRQAELTEIVETIKSVADKDFKIVKKLHTTRKF